MNFITADCDNCLAVQIWQRVKPRKPSRARRPNPKYKPTVVKSECKCGHTNRTPISKVNKWATLAEILRSQQCHNG